jgi:hypothetical protein
MQKKSLVNWLLTCLVITLSANLFFQSCKKEETAQDKTIMVEVPRLEGVVFESGRLKFNSAADFENALEKLRQYKKHLSAFEKQFEGFVSSYSKFVELSNQPENLSLQELPKCMTMVKMSDGETYIRPSVDFHFFDHLANPEGIYQVDKTVYKFTYDNVYRSTEQFVTLLTSGTPANLKNNPNIEILPIERISKEIVKERVELAECEWFYQSSGSKKFHGEVKSRIYPGYAQMSVDFDHYKKSLGVWWLNDAPSMSISGSLGATCCTFFNSSGGTYRDCCTGNSEPNTVGNSCSLIYVAPTNQCVYSTSASGSNEGEIFDVILEKSEGSHFSLLSPSNITFTGKGDDNVTKTCTISQ